MTPKKTHSLSRCCCTLLPWLCLSAFSETTLEPARDIAEIPHPSRSSCLSPDCLLTPVVFPLAGSRESTGRATALLEVEATSATPNTEGVGLVPPLTKTPCSLPHCSNRCRETLEEIPFYFLFFIF